MESTFTTKAIILNRKDHGENDLKVDVLTRDKGRLSLIARGGKKMRSKLAAHVEPFTVSDVMIVKGKQMDYIGSAVGREFFLDLKGDLVKLYYAGAASKMSLKELKEEEGSDSSSFFELLREFWILLDQRREIEKRTAEMWYIFFMLKFLHLYGISPQLGKCVLCDTRVTSKYVLFSIEEGGVVCPRCKEGVNSAHLLTISDNCIKIITLILFHDLSQGREINVEKEAKLSREVKSVVRRFYFYNKQ